MDRYWTALDIIKQTAGELGLPQPLTVVGLDDVQSTQLLALMHAACSELQNYYPWEQLVKQYSFTVTSGDDAYVLPDDFGYMIDQTQWNATSQEFLQGPRSAQEWGYLGNAAAAGIGILRFRIVEGHIKFRPTPTATADITLEYNSRFWVATPGSSPIVLYTDKVTLDTDIVALNPWLVVRFVKLKFYELKGLPTGGVNTDFMRIFQSLTGKDSGARVLSLNHSRGSNLLGPGSIPEGSWGV